MTPMYTYWNTLFMAIMAVMMIDRIRSRNIYGDNYFDDGIDC